ncbi:protein 5NUC-like [Planococcus citri]|uniref:protein 5NUC-like n=1 Tax=Planococcus citri TaxID=170843 RepID=UPI0031F92A90
MNQLVAYVLLFSTHVYLTVEAVETVKTSEEPQPTEPAVPKKGHYKLQILHNNDLHARFDEMDENTGPCPEEYVKENKCYGGFARMKWAADQAREQAKSQGIPSIFVNAGDNFQGTPYYTVFKWKIVRELIDKLEMDVMTLGNHEFDDGIEDLVKYLENLQTPVVCTNIDLNEEPRLNLPEKLTKSKILTVGEGEEKKQIGVIGYLTPTTMRPEKMPTLKISDEIPEIQKEAKRLRDNGIKIIIALGHSGFNFDMKVAKEVEEISLVIGGDSHTLLYTPPEDETDKQPSVERVTSEYPTIVIQPRTGKKVPVIQAYGFGKYLGKLIVEFDDEGNVVEAKGNPQLLDSTVEKDLDLENAVSAKTKEVEELIPGFKEIKGYTRASLGKAIFKLGQFESNLANLITDAFVDLGVQLAHEENASVWTKTPISFYPNGGIRIEVDRRRARGALTLEDFMYIMPFENKMYQLTARGSTIRQFLEKSISAYDKDAIDFDSKHYIEFSGLRVVFDLTKPVGERVASADALCNNCDIPEFRPLDNDAEYGIITIEPGFNEFRELQPENTNGIPLDYKDIDVVLFYINKRNAVAPAVDNRVTVTGFQLKDGAPITETEDNINTVTKTIKNEVEIENQ